MKPRYEFVTDDLDDPRIDEVRNKIKKLNEAQKELEERFPERYYSWQAGYYDGDDYVRGSGAVARTRYYLWLRGRGNRTSPEKIQAWKDAFKQKYGKDYNWSDEGVKRRLAQDLPIWMAERAAVYIMSRIEWVKPSWHK